MHSTSPAYPFVALLERHFEEIRAEALAVRLEDYRAWPLEQAYRGGWKVFCLYSRDPSWVLAPGTDANARRCPRTRAVMERIPGVLRGGFSLLLPGTHIFLHEDERTEDSLRCHLGLVTNSLARIRFGDSVLSWEAGRCLVFDGATAHEAANQGAEPRIVLLVDVETRAVTSEVLA